MNYILARTIRRRTKYLNERYQWGDFPHAFEEAHFATVVLPEAMQYKDRPQRVGELVNGDLDSAIWTELK